MKNDYKRLTLALILYRQAPKCLLIAVALGTCAGALYSLLIPFITGTLAAQTPSTANLSDAAGYRGTGQENLAAMFFGLCSVILAAKAASVVLVNSIAKSAAAHLRIAIARKINRVSIESMEKEGFPRLLTVLTEDINHVTTASIAIPMLLVAAVTVIGMLGYLATLNPTIFAMVLLTICIGVLIYRVPCVMATELYEKARSLRDAVQEGIRGLILGAYELKLNREKSRAYIEEELALPQLSSLRLEKRGDAMIHLAGTSSDLLSFFVIGLIVFVVPQFAAVKTTDSYGIVMALLYIAGPITAILSAVPHLRMGQVSLARIKVLLDLEDEGVSESCASIPGASCEVSVRDVTYAYPGQSESFSLSPVSLDFKPGQINFIVGGNGSGKTTLSKLLSLHYKPASGTIFFNGTPIDETTLQAARSRISVIFSNYYLFGRVYVEDHNVDAEMINGYLEGLGLKGKTRFVNGRFTTTRLSDGQRRRLALLAALAENKDIYIFDEWAADQDPDFKQIFYKNILQRMKKDNKLVIVITHDDRYFDCADRVIFMENGSVIGIRERTENVEHQAMAASVVGVAGAPRRVA